MTTLRGRYWSAWSKCTSRGSSCVSSRLDANWKNRRRGSREWCSGARRLPCASRVIDTQLACRVGLGLQLHDAPGPSTAFESQRTDQWGPPQGRRHGCCALRHHQRAVKGTEMLSGRKLYSVYCVSSSNLLSLARERLARTCVTPLSCMRVRPTAFCLYLPFCPRMAQQCSRSVFFIILVRPGRGFSNSAQ